MLNEFQPSSEFDEMGISLLGIAHEKHSLGLMATVVMLVEGGVGGPFGGAWHMGWHQTR